MLKDITIGQYYPANSKIHKLDPRTKIIAAIIFMIALFVVNQFWPYYLFAFALASLVTAIYFKDKLQFKLFFLFLGFGLIVLLFVQHIIVLWLMIVLLVLWFIGYFTINLILAKRSKNKNG